MKSESLPPSPLERLREFSTCVVASSIEVFGVRLPNVGFANYSVKCRFPELAPVAGYAVTARIRSSDPPMEGGNYYHRPDWWGHIQKMPAPRIVVIQDTDNPPGLGAFVGEVHANILAALGCVAVVTNGAVRDIREVRGTGFQMFSGNVSVSHAYAHIFDFGGTVSVGGLKVGPGDLIHGDANGVLNVPIELAARIPDVAAGIIEKRRSLIEVCRSPEFSLARLRQTAQEAKS